MGVWCRLHFPMREVLRVQPAGAGVLALGATSSIDVKVFSIMTAFTAWGLLAAR